MKKNNKNWKRLSSQRTKRTVIYPFYLNVFFFKNKIKSNTFFKNKKNQTLCSKTKKKYTRKGFPRWIIFFLTTTFINENLFYQVFDFNNKVIIRCINIYIDPYLDFIDMMLEDEKIVFGYTVFFMFSMYFIHLYNEWKKYSQK